jgi:hypothetical protein
MPPKRGRPYASTIVRRAFFTMQVRPPGGHGQTLTLHVPKKADPAQPDRSPQAVDRLELVPGLGLLCAMKGAAHTEYPVGQVLQLELAEVPIAVDEAEAAE